MSFYGKKDLPQGKWDREEYARKGRERQQAEYERRQRGGREPTPENAVEAEHRTARIDIYEGLNQVSLVPVGASTGKRGKSAGFYCEICDLTFKDSIQYLDHINSKQHLYASGQTEVIRRATLEDVRKRLDYLRNIQKNKSKDLPYDISERIKERKRIEQEELEQKRRRRADKKKKNRLEENIQDENNDMAAMLGFSGFATSKR